MPTIRIDPKMFISKPYTKCPKCNGKKFGVLGIYGNSYTKRCMECRYDERYSLPRLKRKIIYLDQFVISNMMKSINASLGKEDKVDPFYLELFKKLDRLNKLQLIVCPDSPIQDDESRLSSTYKDLKRMFEQLSHGTSFYHTDIVKRFQVHCLFKVWAGIDCAPLDIYDFIYDSGDIDGWDSRLIVSVSSEMSADDLQGIRNEKINLAESMKPVIEGWKSSKKSFRDVYEHEISSFGPSILRRYFIDLLNYEKAMQSPEDLPSLLLGSVLSETSVLMTSINEDLSNIGYDDTERLLKAKEFMESDLIKTAPYAIISSILYAGLAEDYRNGREKYPSLGFFNDVSMLSGYAPYCDAMFVDKECHRFLTSKSAVAVYDLSNRIFSLNNKDSFLKYLDSIERDMSKEHYDLVKKVYGEDWPEPYLNMYE